MINTNEVAERRNEKLFNKLSDLIDKKILELSEEDSGFVFEVFSTTPQRVVDDLVSAYRKSGWSVAGNKSSNALKGNCLHFEMLKKPEILSFYKTNSLLAKIGIECDKLESDFEHYRSFKNISSLNDTKEVDTLNMELTEYEDGISLVMLDRSSKPENTIYTYAPTFTMALSDAASKLEYPTKMIMSAHLYNKIFRETLSFDEIKKLEFSAASSRDFLLTRLYAHIAFTDIHIFFPDDEFSRALENDIFIVDSVKNPIPFVRIETILEKKDGYSLEYDLKVGLSEKISRIRVYR